MHFKGDIRFYLKFFFTICENRIKIDRVMTIRGQRGQRGSARRGTRGGGPTPALRSPPAGRGAGAGSQRAGALPFGTECRTGRTESGFCDAWFSNLLEDSSIGIRVKVRMWRRIPTIRRMNEPLSLTPLPFSLGRTCGCAGQNPGNKRTPLPAPSSRGEGIRRRRFGRAWAHRPAAGPRVFSLALRRRSGERVRGEGFVETSFRSTPLRPDRTESDQIRPDPTKTNYEG